MKKIYFLSILLCSPLFAMYTTEEMKKYMAEPSDPILLAIFNKRTFTVDSLETANKVVKYDNVERSYLEWAVGRENKQAVQLLIENGAEYKSLFDDLVKDDADRTKKYPDYYKPRTDFLMLKQCIHEHESNKKS